jgi:DNA-binding NarL/FixJ family response regulator
MTVQFMLVDDHEIIRQGLRLQIDNHPDWAVCCEAADGITAVEMAREKKPDVIVVDIGLPRLSGIEVTVQICSFLPEVKVIALSMHTEATFVGRMLRAGAKGYVPKSSAYDELVTAVQTVLKGQVYVSPSVTGFLVDEFVLEEKKRGKQGLDLLTPTERLVLQQIASGLQSKEIADELNISPHTVNTHRRTIMKKLNASGIADLTRLAIQEGLV